MSPPGTAIRTQPREAGLQGNPGSTTKSIFVIGAWWMDHDKIDRKKAAHYVTQGRAVWAGDSCIRIVECHLVNREALGLAEQNYAAALAGNQIRGQILCSDASLTTSRQGNSFRFRKKFYLHERGAP